MCRAFCSHSNSARGSLRKNEPVATWGLGLDVAEAVVLEHCPEELSVAVHVVGN